MRCSQADAIKRNQVTSNRGNTVTFSGISSVFPNKIEVQAAHLNDDPAELDGGVGTWNDADVDVDAHRIASPVRRTGFPS